MKQIVLWEIIFCMELMKYSMAYRIIAGHHLQIQGKYLSGILIVSFLTILLLRPNQTINDAYILFVILSLAFLFRSMKGRYLERSWQVLVTFLNVTAIDALMENSARQFIRFQGISLERQTLLWDGASLVCMLIILLIVKRFKRRLVDKSEQYTRRSMHFAMVLADICLCLGAALMFRHQSDNRLYFWMGIVSFIGMIFLGSQILFILEWNRILKDTVIQERILNSTQKEYYQTILHNEEETRKYRHDMNNHFMVIQSYLDTDKVREAQAYIDQLQAAFDSTSIRKYALGNDVIDAISRYYLFLVEDFVKIQIKGYVPDIGIDPIHLCTIYANLLKNGVEELQRLHEENEKDLKLMIHFISGKQFLKMEIINSAKINAQFKGTRTPTSKADKSKHGIGLTNVRRALDKENGTFRLFPLDDAVCAEVIIPFKTAQEGNRLLAK